MFFLITCWAFALCRVVFAPVGYPLWVQATVGVSVLSTIIPKGLQVAKPKRIYSKNYEIHKMHKARDAIGKHGDKEKRAGWVGVRQIDWHSQCSSVQQVDVVHNQLLRYYEWDFVYLFNLYLTTSSLERQLLERPWWNCQGKKADMRTRTICLQQGRIAE